MRALRTIRFWVLLLFVAFLAAIGIGTIVFAINVTQAPGLTPDERIGEEGVVWAGASFVVAVVAAVLALLAYGVASQRPSLRVWTRINDDHRGPDSKTVFHDEYVDDPKGTQFFFESFHWMDLGPKLWIRVFNDAGYSARSPAVSVEVIGFEVDARIVGKEQTGWKEAQPRSDPKAVAWMWDGGDSAIHGPRWFRALPHLDLKGIAPPANAGTASIRIEAVAEGDRTVQTITFATDP
jgi:hypothetical protein